MGNKVTAFYRFALPEPTRSAYAAAYEAMDKPDAPVTLKNEWLEKSPYGIWDIFNFLEIDNPGRIVSYPNLCNRSGVEKQAAYRFSYFIGPQEIEARQKKLDAICRIFCQRYIRPGMSDYQKISVIHRYLIETVTYNKEAADRQTETEESCVAFTAWGALGVHRAVCMGIACAVKLLCDRVGISSIVVLGNVLETSRLGEKHAWNIVRLDGENYHLDVTFDLLHKGMEESCYDFFNVNDTFLRRNRTWDNKLYPACGGYRLNYFYKNGLYVRESAQIEEFLVGRIRVRERHILLKVLNGLPEYDEVKRQMDAAVRQGAREGIRIGDGCCFWLDRRYDHLYAKMIYTA